MPFPPADIGELKRTIVKRQLSLPRRVRVVLRTALEEPYLVAFGTAGSLAQACCVGETTVLRTSKCLGFASYTQFRGLFRTHLQA
ncbi:MurR/RpiR family transcriptional regulator [Shinella yambaruensis]|uniref:HTH rpiR-type domain-containing protein n=1 Tax=Shinella yambaruensis TaxID=415996 RepID=A0ABQ5ZL77_9HYPH|nr:MULTISPECIES: MurR/RpiR family transcriptional regulator [Shinella]MCJ8026257.1 MurR/RpiR family transcriptional regulator [Shinella yambaruensis]MCO5136394.1 MurR/RpiR family transcriptional regulator [Shinella sp.]MCU7981664.1 MurR/RpiR family transcriptional regulator [Shinella yambaruensis]MDC7253931.1 MurR/RpiR family transcriptional regulator [Shinella sp. YE25]GLR53609.1 hypothetical protein GCM10007923_48250 [Shinella yambaruensis]